MAASPPPDEDSDEFDEDDAFWSLRFMFVILPDIIFVIVPYDSNNAPVSLVRVLLDDHSKPHKDD